MAFFDRSKVKIDLHLNRGFFIPGETLRGRLHLTVYKSVTLTAVRLYIRGKEKATRRKRSRTVLLEEHVHLEKVLTFLGEPPGSKRKACCQLQVGEFDYPFQLELPPTLPPSIYCPVRSGKTKIYYFVEAVVVVPSGFDGKKRREIIIFPAARQEQWDLAHTVPYGLTGFTPEQLLGANMSRQGLTLRASSPASSPASNQFCDTNKGVDGKALDSIAREKERIHREIEEAQVRSGTTALTLPPPRAWATSTAGSSIPSTTAAAAAAAATTSTATQLAGVPELTLDDAVRLPVRAGRFTRKEVGCLELAVKVLPAVMALSTHSMFPIIAAVSEGANSRVNRPETNEVHSEDGDSDSADFSGDDDDDEDSNSGFPERGKQKQKQQRGAQDSNRKGDVCRVSAPMDSEDSDSGNADSNNRSSSSSRSDNESVGAISQPETVSSPMRVAALTNHPLPPPHQTQQQYSTTNSCVPSVVRPAVDQLHRLGGGGGGGGGGGDSSTHSRDVTQPTPFAPPSVPGNLGNVPSGSFAQTVTTYDDSKCLVRVTLHNGMTQKKVKGFSVELYQFLRISVDRYHASRRVRLGKCKYSPPHGPLQPGQTITVDVPLQMPRMLRLSGEMDKTLPIPTLRTHTLEVTNVLAITFKDGLKLEHQFSRNDCVFFVSAVDEMNRVPEVPAVFTCPHIFKEDVVTGHMY